MVAAEDIERLSRKLDALLDFDVMERVDRKLDVLIEIGRSNIEIQRLLSDRIKTCVDAISSLIDLLTLDRHPDNGDGDQPH